MCFVTVGAVLPWDSSDVLLIVSVGRLSVEVRNKRMQNALRIIIGIAVTKGARPGASRCGVDNAVFALRRLPAPHECRLRSARTERTRESPNEPPLRPTRVNTAHPGKADKGAQ